MVFQNQGAQEKCGEPANWNRILVGRTFKCTVWLWIRSQTQWQEYCPIQGCNRSLSVNHGIWQTIESRKRKLVEPRCGGSTQHSIASINSLIQATLAGSLHSTLHLTITGHGYSTLSYSSQGKRGPPVRFSGPRKQSPPSPGLHPGSSSPCEAQVLCASHLLPGSSGQNQKHALEPVLSWLHWWGRRAWQGCVDSRNMEKAVTGTPQVTEWRPQSRSIRYKFHLEFHCCCLTPSLLPLPPKQVLLCMGCPLRKVATSPGCGQNFPTPSQFPLQPKPFTTKGQFSTSAFPQRLYQQSYHLVSLLARF